MLDDYWDQRHGDRVYRHYRWPYAWIVFLEEANEPYAKERRLAAY